MGDVSLPLDELLADELPVERARSPRSATRVISPSVAHAAWCCACTSKQYTTPGLSTVYRRAFLQIRGKSLCPAPDAQMLTLENIDTGVLHVRTWIYRPTLSRLQVTHTWPSKVPRAPRPHALRTRKPSTGACHHGFAHCFACVAHERRQDHAKNEMPARPIFVRFRLLLSEP